MKRELLRLGDSAASLLGSYGANRDAMDSTAARLGLRYEWGKGAASFSLYGGVLRASGDVPIPGHAEVFRPRVSVSDDSMELRARYSLRF